MVISVRLFEKNPISVRDKIFSNALWNDLFSSMDTKLFLGNRVRGWGAPSLRYKKRENRPVVKGNRTKRS
jgi:hypothetical protein